MAKLYPYYQHIVSKGLGKYKRHVSAWLKEEVVLPIRLPFPAVKESDAAGNITALQNWIQHWQQHPYSQNIVWQETHWKKLNFQKIPIELQFHTIEEFIKFINKQKEWSKLMALNNLSSIVVVS